MPPLRNRRINLPLNERIKDGRIFEVSRRTDRGVIYLRCQTKFCIGTAKKMRNGDIVTQRQHSDICYEDRNGQTKADFMIALKSALERNFWKLKDVYDTVVAMYPRNIKVLVPYNSIVDSLKRWRRSFYPPCPENLDQMSLQLEQPENERLLQYDVGRLVSKSIIDIDGNLHLLIYDQQFVETEFANAEKLFIDATFQTTPRIRGVYQLLCILAVKYDHALPFMHVLMSKKTQIAYTAVLSEITNLIHGATVRIVMTDFETALRNACREIFVNAHVTGCNTHYDRALLKKIKSTRLMPLIRDNEVAKVFLKKIMALAYLPQEMIEREFMILKNTLSPALKRTLSTFLSYYARQWLRTVKPAGFSVYGLSRRTNNVVESYNSVLAGKLGPHPSAWTFMAKLVKLTSNARDDLRSLRLNKRIRRQPRYATNFKQKELTNAWRLLHSGEITPAEFLDKTAMLKGHITQRLQNIPDDHPSEDELELDGEAAAIAPFDDPDYDHHLFANIHFGNVGPQNANAPVEDLNHESDSHDDSDNESLSTVGHEAQDESDVDSSSSPDESLARGGDLSEPAHVSVHDSDSASSVESQAEDGDLEMIDIANNAQREEAPITFPQAPQEQLVEEPSVPEVFVGHESNQRVSVSRKKNLKKKRRQRMKAQLEERQVRPYGRKRRKTRKTLECVVCKGANITHGFVPCGHNCCCETCASELATRAPKTCPKCRANIRETIRIFNE